MTPLARIAFAVLAAATVGAFFVTQRLKRAPAVVQAVRFTAAFSPNGDGVRDLARFSFRLKQSDDVTAIVVSADGDVVSRLTSSLSVAAHRRVRLVWDGLSDAGIRAPDGDYEVRIGLRREGRSVPLATPVRLDTRAPRAVLRGIGPHHGPGPQLFPLPHLRAVTVRLRVRGDALPPTLLIYRTDGPRPRLAGRVRGHHRGRARWNGLLDGQPAPPGTYLIAVRLRDRAGNTATLPPRLPPVRGRVRGRPGVTIRYVAARPPLVPVRAGAIAGFTVAGPARSYRWVVRRAGRGRVLLGGSGGGRRLTLRAPARTGLYVLTLRSKGHAATVPFAVDARPRRRVLVVRPAVTWQGLGQVDDDGDGFPDTLAVGAPVPLGRPSGGTGPPRGLRAGAAALIAALDRGGMRYDLTTDLALADGRGPALAGHTGVVLAPDAVWVPRGLPAALRRYVKLGGRVLSLGTGSLRRAVSIVGDQLVAPSGAAPADAFGSRLGAVVRRPVRLLASVDRLGLFRGTRGTLAGFDAFEPTTAIAPPATVLAAAGPAGGPRVLVAYRLVRGIVVRTGLPQWSERLRRRGDPARVMGRLWALLSR